MASAPNPVAAMLQRQLISRLAGQSPQQASTPDSMGDQLSQQFSQLAGADPQTMAKALMQVKTIMVALYPKLAFQIPEAARHVAQAQKGIDNAIGIVEKAAAAVNTVQPIVNNAAMTNPMMGGSPPDDQGAF